MPPGPELRIVFAGTPAFAVPALRALIDMDITVAAVFTQPDRPSGRGRKLTASPVKMVAVEHGIPVHQPERFDPAATAVLSAQAADLMLVVAYGLLLPATALQITAHGCVNVHASLLPRWRGAAPIARAIEAGDETTGVCLMQMTAGLDEGPVLASASTAIATTDTAASLHDRLAEMGGVLLRHHLAAIAAGELTPVPQKDDKATYAQKLSKAEATIDWRQDAALIERRIRAFNPWPVATTRHDTTLLKVWAAKLLSKEQQLEPTTPGTVIAITKDYIRVSGRDRDIGITRLQRPGGRPLDVAQFLSGYSVQVGERLS